MLGLAPLPGLSAPFGGLSGFLSAQQLQKADVRRQHFENPSPGSVPTMPSQQQSKNQLIYAYGSFS